MNFGDNPFGPPPSMTNPKSGKSTLQRQLMTREHILPKCLRSEVSIKAGESTSAAGDAEAIQRLFPNSFGQPILELIPTAGADTAGKSPLNVGVVLSGGQASGGHNVICSIFDSVKRHHPDSKVFGFLGGPKGIFTGKYMLLEAEYVDKYRNQGGFDMIRSGRDKIETPDQFAGAAKVVQSLSLNGLVVIGGDDSNTNAALLAEYFSANKIPVTVIGCPKTIDGDLKTSDVLTSFGFDTACKVYSSSIANIAHDCLSSRKYYHFVRLMGRSASHITLECALQVAPNVTIIGEEVAAEKKTLHQITMEVCDVIVQRASLGKNYGMVLIPEGLIEFIPEVGALIGELNEILAKLGSNDGHHRIAELLTPASRQVFQLLPDSIRDQLLLERDPHGNVQVSRIESESLLILLCEAELAARQAAGNYQGTFHSLTHFLGYEGRSGMPSNFDSHYCYGLGAVATALVAAKKTGYMAVVKNLQAPITDWSCWGVPITGMMNIERRKGQDKPVIRKALVELDGPVFAVFAAMRKSWQLADVYRNPGDIQYAGSVADSLSYTLHYTLEGSLAPHHQPTSVTAHAQGKLAHPFQWQRERSMQSPLERLRGSAGVTLPVLCREDTDFLPYTPAIEVQATHPNQAVRARFAHLYAQVPSCLKAEASQVAPKEGGGHTAEAMRSLVIGVVFLGRQAPGCHNILTALTAFAQSTGGSALGFLGGAAGLAANEVIDLASLDASLLYNSGGLHALGRSKDQLVDKLPEVLATLKQRACDGLVVVGGPRSATEAALLAEACLKSEDPCCSSCKIVALPASVDGDLKSPYLSAMCGFDTASKVFSHLIGNVATDCASAAKYYYFMRLMGRHHSHVTLECALQTRPNITIIGEEMLDNRFSLAEVTRMVADVICGRAEEGKNFGTVLIPEGLPEMIPELSSLMRELQSFAGDITKLTPWSRALFDSFPEDIQAELQQSPGTYGSVHLSQIHMEKLLILLVSKELSQRKAAGTYSGTFSAIPYFFGYEARSAMPSRFDASLAAALAYTACMLIHRNITGVMATLENVTDGVEGWRPLAIPLTLLLHPEEGHIRSASVNLNGSAFAAFAEQRRHWAMHEDYRNPGPIQWEGPAANVRNKTVLLELQSSDDKRRHIQQLCEEITALTHAGASHATLHTAESMLHGLRTALGTASQL